MTGPTEAEGFPTETERAERAYANGWRDSALSLAAEFDRRANRPGPAVAIGALLAAAEVAIQQAQDEAVPGQVMVSRDDLHDALTMICLHVPPDFRPSVIVDRLSAAVEAGQ